MDYSLTDVKDYLIDRYIKDKSAEQEQYILLNSILFDSMEKNLQQFKALPEFKSSSDFIDKIGLYDETIQHFRKVISSNEFDKKIFIKEYAVDMNEIDAMLVELFNNDLKNLT